MELLENIFNYYDKLIANLSPSAQAFISLLLFLFLIWQVYQIFKSGHWIFIALLIILLPGTWPAAKHIGNIILTILKFLLTRAQGIFS